MATLLFVLAMAGLCVFMVRYARRYGSGATREDGDSTQYGWDSGSGDGGSNHD